MTEKKKDSHESVRDSLPAELQAEFEQLVEDYRFAAHTRYGKRFVSYVVLGDLIRAGWRRSAEENSG